MRMTLTRLTASKSIDEPEEKLIVRLAITYGVLRRLGLTEARVEECLRSIRGVDLDEAFDWVSFLPQDTSRHVLMRSVASPSLRRGRARSSARYVSYGSL